MVPKIDRDLSTLGKYNKNPMKSRRDLEQFVIIFSGVMEAIGFVLNYDTPNG